MCGSLLWFIKTHTHLNNAVDQRLDGSLDVTACDHEQRVLEISAGSTVSVSPTQNNVILPVQIPVLPLQCLQNLHTHTHTYCFVCFVKTSNMRHTGHKDRSQAHTAAIRG